MWAIVVGAGRGTRYGGLKQFDVLAGRPIHEWSVSAARRAASHVVLVVPEDMVDDVARQPAIARQVDRVVSGGATRADSVRAGLAAVHPSAALVLVHDAARPLASAALFRAVIERAARPDVEGAVPGLPLSDTVKRVDGDVVRTTLDRSDLVGVQTPQGFKAAWLRRAHATAEEATDDAALVEAAGGRIGVVPGDADNFKITTAADLTRAEAVVRAGASAP